MPLEVVQGSSPIILSLPYTGTNMQRNLVQRLNERDRWLTAPDLCLDRLVGGVFDNISFLRAGFHRYLSDVEHPDDGDLLKPRKGMVGVVPLLDHDGQSIWHHPPNGKEAMTWRAMYYAPYHAAIAAQIARVRARVGHAILLTCRAQRTPVPAIPGAEPADVNICTYMGASCAIDLPVKLQALMQSSDQFTASLNGQLEAGGSTRRFGRPSSEVHALDLQINEASYLDSAHNSDQLDLDKAKALRRLLTEAFALIAEWRPK